MQEWTGRMGHMGPTGKAQDERSNGMVKQQAAGNGKMSTELQPTTAPGTVRRRGLVAAAAVLAAGAVAKNLTDAQPVAAITYSEQLVVNVNFSNAYAANITNNDTSGYGGGVYGQGVTGVKGYTGVTSAPTTGVYGESATGNGVYGLSHGSTSSAIGVYGTSGGGTGVAGVSTGNAAGVVGQSATNGVYGNSTGSAGNSIGVYGASNGAGGPGVAGVE